MITIHTSLRRRLVAVAALAGLVLAACGGGDDDASDDEPASEPTAAGSTSEPAADADAEEASDGLSGTLRWATRESQAATAEAMIAAYKEVEPGVTIEIELLPSPVPEYIQRLVTARLGDDLPDLITTGDQYVSVLADAEITADLSPYLDASETTNQDYFAQNFLEAFIPKSGDHAGEIISLPLGADAVVLFYNKDHFDEAGLEYPTADWTQDDLLTAATALTTADRWGFYERADYAPRYNALTQALGGQLVSDDGTQFLLDSPEALEAWHLMLDPMIDGPYMPREETAAIDKAIAFVQERVSMFPGVRANVPAIRNEAPFEWDVASIPLANGVRKSGSGSLGIGMTQAAEDPELAWAFLEWFFSADGGIPVLTETYGAVPAIPSLFDDPSWTELPAPPANTDAFVEAIETGTPNVRLPFTMYSELNSAIVTAIETVTLAGGSVEEAFAAANVSAQAALDEINADS